MKEKKLVYNKTRDDERTKRAMDIFKTIIK